MIKILCVGKIKEKFIRDALSEYEKRLAKYTHLEMLEVSDFAISPQINKKKEGELLLKHIKEKDYVIALEIEGELLNSIEFSRVLEQTKMKYSCITFVIGGSDGLSEEVLKRSDFRLSFSKMTFPHQLFRILLLEQIYRAFKIENNESYHK